MCGIAVPQGVDANLFMSSGKPAFELGDVDGGPNGGVGHGIRASVHGLAQGYARAFPATSGAGKKPVGIAVALPEVPQPVE